MTAEDRAVIPAATTRPANRVSPLLEKHLEEIAAHYSGPEDKRPAGRQYRAILARYFNMRLPQDASVFEIGCGAGELLELIHARKVSGCDISAVQVERTARRLPHGTFYHQPGECLDVPGTYDVILLSDTINYAGDVQEILNQARKLAAPHTRLVMSFPSAMWRPVYSLATTLGLRARHPQANWIGIDDARNFLNLSGWSIVEIEPKVLLPLQIPVVEPLLNRFLAPLLGFLCHTVICTARPKVSMENCSRRVSVVVPARNEAGNIEAAVTRTPMMGDSMELIFVEGNSTDDTWEEIQRVKAAYPDREIQIMQQPGKGKGDAVRCGFAAATGDILMILDADLTMPPEELPKFYEALVSGHAEFANGVRLVYPMEKEAMRFLNLCANKFFSVAFSWLLAQPVKDTLCGTKVLWKEDYERIAANRCYFGDFDPFGDFDLLFGADRLGLQIVDIPIRYRDRTYGSTNISRWSHGALLFRMLAFAAGKLKFV
ncbi:MAG TPA: glycosyltransferase [Chthoniobacterales bacterium]